MLTQLAETPSRITALTAALSPEVLQTRPTPDEWSANEVLAHLRACADVWGNYILRIIDEDRPTLRAVNPRTWIKQTDYHQSVYLSSLHFFTTQRADLLAKLEPLSSDAWERAATVKGGGRMHEETVLSYAERLVVHERPHIKQIAGIVNTLMGREDGESTQEGIL